jgi:hypothetical protein
MKKLLFLAMGFALTTQMIMAQLPSYVPTNGLVGYWPFNGNANDTSGNVNNGTVNRAALTSDRFGNLNSAYSFLQNQTITVPDNTSFHLTQNLSISIWVYCLANGQTLIRKGYDYGIDIGNITDTQSGLYPIFFTPNLFTQSPLKLNTWNHIVAVRNNSSRFVYINGILNSTLNNSTSFAITNNLLTIGSWNGEPINAKLDDIGIWNRALTQDEITNLYYSENSCQSLVINTGVLGFNPVTYNNTVTIYPNPANDHITIDCGNLANIAGWSIKITNMLGQEVFNQPMNTQQYVVPLNSWNGQGIYFVKIYDGSNNLMNTKKIILQ